ncbi:Putative aryl-alcohol dehydrogenase [Termitomyces sp. J132]|nr:Putative aryl-alcohol dehydrogenase [Termitomyces sp. J132]
MQYGTSKWQEWVLSEEEAIEHIKLAYDAGIQTFDTANVYSNGLSEIILGKAIKQLQLPREEIVILTKVYFTVAREYATNLVATGEKPEDLGYVNQRGLNRKHIFDSVKASLQRLGVEYIDVLQCHRFDYETPIEETMQALHDVVKAGYVRYIGMSSCHAYQCTSPSLLLDSRLTTSLSQSTKCKSFTDYAITHNLTPFISMQNHHSILYREEEREMFLLLLFGVGAIPWSPLARGLLTRPMREQTKRGGTDRFLHHYLKAAGTPEIVKRVEDLATQKGLSMAQIAVMWSLSKEGVTAPIVGTTSIKNLEELIERGVVRVHTTISYVSYGFDILFSVAHMKLTEEEVKYLEEPYVAQAVIGHS